MKKLIIILLILTVLAFSVYTYVKNTIIDRITVDFKTIEFDRFDFTYLNPTLNLRVKMDVFNGSDYNFLIKNFKVTIYDNDSKELIANSRINNLVPINRGNNLVQIKIDDLNVIDNINRYFSNDYDLFMVVEFRLMGIKIVTEEIFKF